MLTGPSVIALGVLLGFILHTNAESTKKILELSWELVAALFASFIVLLVWEREREGPNRRSEEFRKFFGLRVDGPIEVVLVFCTRKLSPNQDDHLRSYLEKQYIDKGNKPFGQNGSAEFIETLEQLGEVSEKNPSLQHRHGVKDWIAKDDIWAARPLVAALEKHAGENVTIGLMTDEDFCKSIEDNGNSLRANVISFGLGFNWATIFLARDVFQIRYFEMTEKDGTGVVIKNSICLDNREISELMMQPRKKDEASIQIPVSHSYAIIARLHCDGKIVFIVGGRDADGTLQAGHFLSARWYDFILSQRRHYKNLDEILDQFDLRLILNNQSGKWLLDTHSKVAHCNLSAFVRSDGMVQPVYPLGGDGGNFEQ